MLFFFFFSSRRRHTRCSRDWSSDVCSSDLTEAGRPPSSKPDQPIRGLQRRSLAPGCVRFSQKSHKVGSYWGLHCFHPFRSLIDGTEAAVARDTEGRWSFPRVIQVPRGQALRTHSQFAPVNVAHEPCTAKK